MSDGSDSEDDGWASIEVKNPKGKKASTVSSDKTKKVTASKKGSNKKGKKNEEVNGVEPSPTRKRMQVMDGIVGAGPKSTAEDTISLALPDALVQADDSADDSAEEEIDDQTATLLKGFESSEDEEEEAEGPTPKQMAGAKIPDEKETRKKIGALAARDKVSVLLVVFFSPHNASSPLDMARQKINYLLRRTHGYKPWRYLICTSIFFRFASSPAQSQTNKSLWLQSTPGVIYLGRVPHGFYEQEMRSYFSQFGTVTRLRLSRNKKTGNSKHYAFIEFADSEVAKIVAETMNNYLLFNHILKCKTVPRDDLEFIEKLFKGSGKKFKPRPGAKLHQRLLERKRTEEQWEKELVKETSKRRSISQKLKNKGIDYEYEAPEVRKAEPEPMQIDAAPVVAAEEAPVTAIEETVIVAATKEPVPEKVAPEKKSKNNKKGKRITTEVAVEELVVVATVEKETPKKVVPEKKGKKGKKEEKNDIVETTPTLAVEEPITKEGVPEKVVAEKRKGRKGKSVAEDVAEAEETITAEEVVPERRRGTRNRKEVTEIVVEKATEGTVTAKEVVPERRRGTRGKKEVAEQVVEKVTEETVEVVAEGDGIDEVEAQAVVKKAKSKAKPPAKAKSSVGKVVKRSAPKKKSKA